MTINLALSVGIARGVFFQISSNREWLNAGRDPLYGSHPSAFRVLSHEIYFGWPKSMSDRRHDSLSVAFEPTEVRWRA